MVFKYLNSLVAVLSSIPMGAQFFFKLPSGIFFPEPVCNFSSGATMESEYSGRGGTDIPAVLEMVLKKTWRR